MTLPSPLVVVSLPGRTIDDVRGQIERSRAEGADLGEVRLDRWAPAERSRAAELFPSPLPLVATLRSRAEGGEGPDSPEERMRELLSAARLPFRWIDLEEARDGAVIDRLPPANALGRILSTHLPAGSPVAMVAERLAGTTPEGCVRKVVLPATIATVVRELLPAIPPAGGYSSVVLTTGPSGALLRAWSRRFGFPFVFASLPAAPRSVAADPVEVSQIPVDRLRPFLDAGGDAPLFGVMGDPVSHSLSPYLHSRWMRILRRAGLYVPLEISAQDEFLEAIGPLADGGFRGLNVTHPWKSVALDAATRVGPGAERSGAANCLTLSAGEVEAENTDLVAVLRRLEAYRREGVWDGRELVVVGSGGAAAATLAAAQELHAESTVLARNRDAARTLANRFGASFVSVTEARPFSLVVHATPVGREGSGPLEVPLERLVGPESRVLDWVYAPVDPILESITVRAGGTYEDGWRLLVYQAAASFGIWWGEEPGSDVIAATIQEGGCAA